jgi:hypothetical protein
VTLLKGHQREQRPQGLHKTTEDKTDGYCFDRQYVIPQAEFTDHQNVKTPEPKSDHRDAAETDHIGKDSSLPGKLLPLPPPNLQEDICSASVVIELIRNEPNRSVRLHEAV